MASLLALLLAGTAACGNVDDSTPEPTGESAGGMSGACTTIDHTVNIDEQSDLTQFAGLDCFTVEGHLFVQNSTNIKNLDALSGLRSVTGYIGIADNTKLKRVTLPNLEKTGEGLVLEGNTMLEKISFPQLQEVGGYLHVFNNPKLESASFPCLEEVGGDVIFAGVDDLDKLKLPCLKKVGGTFIFEHSDDLKYLCLPQLRYVGGGFLVHFNKDLKAILASKLKFIGGMLEIQRNPNLVKVDLRSLEKVKGDVKIVYNHIWSTCKVQKLVDHIDYIGGHTYVHSNYYKCRSVHIYPPSWCSSDACKKCDCKDGDYCEPGDDDDDDDDDMTCEDRCKEKAKMACADLKHYPYKYKKCVKEKYEKCVDKYCQEPGDDDDDDDDDDMTCEDRCKEKAKMACADLKHYPYKYKKCVKEKYEKCVDKYCDDDGDDDDDDDDMTCEERCQEKAEEQCKDLKHYPYKYRKCVKEKFEACVDKYCDDDGDDDDDDDDDDGDGEACTPGYWKNHTNNWCQGVWPTQSLDAIFATDGLFYSNPTMLDALRFHGGPGVEGGARILLRHAVASLLNACHDDVDYPVGARRLVNAVNDALGSGDRQQMLSLAERLDGINNDNECPLGGRATPRPRQR